MACHLTKAVIVLGLLAGTAGAAERGAARAGDPPAVVTDARIAGDAQRTRFVADLSHTINIRVFTLADPYRVVVDLPQVAFHLPPKAGETGRGLIKAFRYGLVMPGGSRIVLDVAKPVRVDKAFVLDAKEGHPARLVLDLAATDRESFLRTVGRDPPPGASARKPSNTHNLERNDPRPVIVLDPGHGGIDHGTRAASGEIEKELVLDFALLLRDLLDKSGKYRVVMTRNEDAFVPLAERVRIARAHQAELFISLHADALRRGDGVAQGATIYTLSETASDAEAARLAEAENRADLIAGIDLSKEHDSVANILIDFAQRETRAFSTHFARTLAAELKKVARLHKHPLKSAGFMVLKAPDVPSVLVELGYVTSPQDLRQLVSDSWRGRTAAAMARAIDAYFATRLAGARVGPN